MTEPVHVTRQIDGVGLIEFVESPKSRAYWFTPDGGQRRQRMPSVTTILNGTQSTPPQLLDWYARNGASAIELRDNGQARGKAAHSYVEAYLTGADLPLLADYPEDWRGYMQGAAAFLFEYDPQPVAVERLVVHPEMRYAGRLDLLARVRDRLTLLDFKTNPKGTVYPKAHVQATAYAIADERCGGEPIEAVMLVGIAADGTFNVVPGVDGSKLWATSLDHYRELQRFERAALAPAVEVPA